jgi:hypothetical protein
MEQNKKNIPIQLRSKKGVIDVLFKPQILLWLNGLSLQEKRKVLCITGKQIVMFITKMYQVQGKKPRGFFFDIDQSYGDKSLLEIEFQIASERNFIPSLHEINNFQLIDNVETEFLEELRVGDHDTFLDILTLSKNLLTNTKKFIYYMNILSRGQFLTSPCKGKEFYLFVKKN